MWYSNDTFHYTYMLKAELVALVSSKSPVGLFKDVIPPEVRSKVDAHHLLLTLADLTGVSGRDDAEADHYTRVTVYVDVASVINVRKMRRTTFTDQGRAMKKKKRLFWEFVRL